MLNNWRRHREDQRGTLQAQALWDPYSSGAQFDGWTSGPLPVFDGFVPLATAPPRTWLLREGWKMYGAIRPREVPGKLRRAR